MKGAYLIPDTSEEGKLQGPIGAAEITNVNYDPVINMTYEEYESNLQKHAQLSLSVHEKLSGVILGLIAMGALSNAWNPVGWILAGVAAIIGLASHIGLFKDKAAWDGERTGKAWDKISHYYEASVLGQRTGKVENGKPVFSGGLATMASATAIQDELVQTIINSALKGLTIYEAFFAKEAAESWKSDTSKKNTEQLARLTRDLKNNFLGKIKSYERVYDITWTKINVSLADGIFDEDYLSMGLEPEPIGLGRDRRKDITFELYAIQLKRKKEYIGAGLTFSDFNDAASPKATFFEKEFADEKGRKEMFKFGETIIKTLALEGYLTSDEADYYNAMNWLNSADAYDKAAYLHNWDTPWNPKITSKTEENFVNSQCVNMSLVMGAFLRKEHPYHNAKPQDLIKLLKAAKTRHDKYNTRGRGTVAPDCQQLLRTNPKVIEAFKAMGMNINDYDDNFNYLKRELFPSPTDPNGQSPSQFSQNGGLINPNGYTNEYPYSPYTPAPTRPQGGQALKPSAPSQPTPTVPNQAKSQPTPTVPNQGKSQLAPTAPTQPAVQEKKSKKKSLWWIWLLVAGAGLYVINENDKKNGKH